MRIPNHHRLPLLTVVAVGVLTMLAATLLLSWPQSAFAQAQEQGGFTGSRSAHQLDGRVNRPKKYRTILDSAQFWRRPDGYMIERSEDGTTGWKTAGTVTGANIATYPRQGHTTGDGVRNHILLPGFGY